MLVKKEENFMRNNDCENEPCVKEHKPCACVTAKTEVMAEQVCVAPTLISEGDVYVKLPVILAKSNVTIPIEATITLDRPAVEIKRVKKNVYLTQARLIPPARRRRGFGDLDLTGIVFVQGFIRKNIEYATQTCSSCDGTNICGDIGHCIVETPFEFTTRVIFFRPPIFQENIATSEFEFFTDELKSCDECADNIVGKNPCDESFTFIEYFNEKPYVELVSAAVTELDIHKHSRKNGKNPTEQIFRRFTEKVIVNLTFKLLQKQQVRLTALEPDNPCPDFGDQPISP